MALSKSGRYLATGQVTYMGFTADIIIWDLDTRQLVHRMGLHKVRAAHACPPLGSDACVRAPWCAMGHRAWAHNHGAQVCVARHALHNRGPQA